MSDTEDLSLLNVKAAAVPQPADGGQSKREKRHKRDKKQKHDRRDKAAKSHRREVVLDDAARFKALHGGSESDEGSEFDFDAPEESDGSVKGGNAFIDDAADEGTDSDDEPVEDTASEIAAVAKIRDYKRKTTIFEDDMKNLSTDEIAKNLDERYRRRREARELQPSSQFVDSNQRFSSAFLPQPGDPKVFAVKVRPGYARLLVARIVNKCHAYLRGENQLETRQDLGIMSVFSVDHVKEWIYIEAHRQRFVETAITGLEHIFRFKITQVDPKELMQLLSRQIAHRDELQVGQYVRIKSGPYAGDLALVNHVHDEGQRAEVRLAPREDFVQRSDRPKYVKGSPKLPQQLFVPHQAIGSIELQNGDFQWADLTFSSSGHLLKVLAARQLLFGAKCEAPTDEEIAVLYNHDPDAIRDAVLAVQASSAPKIIQQFAPDEEVRVTAGQLIGVVGRVVDTGNATGLVSVSTVSSQGAVTQVVVPADEISKHFAVGTHIIVESGPNAGQSGTVIFSQHANVIFVADDGQTEFTVKAMDCRRSRMTASKPHQVGAHKLFDLVALADSAVVGCVVGFSGNGVTIITTHNSLMRTTIANIGQTLREKSSVTDKMSNKITVNDAVMVEATTTLSKFAKVKATVLHVYQDTVFLVARELRENSGVFAANSKSVIRIGGQAKYRQQSSYVQPRVAPREPHPAKPGLLQRDSAGLRSLMSAASQQTNAVDAVADDFSSAF